MVSTADDNFKSTRFSTLKSPRSSTAVYKLCKDESIIYYIIHAKTYGWCLEHFNESPITFVVDISWRQLRVFISIPRSCEKSTRQLKSYLNLYILSRATWHDGTFGLDQVLSATKRFRRRVEQTDIKPLRASKRSTLQPPQYVIPCMHIGRRRKN